MRSLTPLRDSVSIVVEQMECEMNLLTRRAERAERARDYWKAHAETDRENLRHAHQRIDALRQRITDLMARLGETDF